MELSAIRGLSVSVQLDIMITSHVVTKHCSVVSVDGGPKVVFNFILNSYMGQVSNHTSQPSPRVTVP